MIVHVQHRWSKTNNLSLIPLLYQSPPLVELGTFSRWLSANDQSKKQYIHIITQAGCLLKAQGNADNNAKYYYYFVMLLLNQQYQRS